MHPLLQRSLQANAVFSGVSGLILMSLAPLMGLLLGGWPAWIVSVLGAGLALFALDLSVMAWGRKWLRLVPVVIGLDILWVAASLVLIALRPFWISPQARLAMVMVAAVVLTFAVLQYFGWRRTPHTSL